MNEYQAGTVDYTATARATQYSAWQSARNVHQRQLAAVSLIGDLGGGWTNRALDCPAKPATAP